MRYLTTIMLTLAVWLGGSAVMPCVAQPNGVPAYARQRAGIHSGWDGRGRDGGFRHDYDPGSYRHQRFYRGYVPYQPVVAGSWYARPYPHHFDYYRQRYSTPLPQASDCPCRAAPLQ